MICHRPKPQYCLACGLTHTVVSSGKLLCNDCQDELDEAKMNEDGTHGPEHTTNEGIELRSRDGDPED